MMECPCGQPMQEEIQTSLRLQEEVRVLFCPCKREREVVEDDDLRFCTSSQDKFKINAGKL
jgi:hypothetical protein